MIKAQKKAQEILDKCIKQYNLYNIRIMVKNINRGHAHYKTRLITIPLWANKESKYYFTYYVLHEIAHFINKDKFGTSGHDSIFMKIESDLLYSYNLKAIYNKVYAKKIIKIKKGKD